MAAEIKSSYSIGAFYFYALKIVTCWLVCEGPASPNLYAIIFFPFGLTKILASLGISAILYMVHKVTDTLL